MYADADVVDEHHRVVVGQVRGDEGGDDDDDDDADDDDDDGGDDIAQIQELVGWRNNDRFRRSARVACNRRWIAMSRKGSGSLNVSRRAMVALVTAPLIVVRNKPIVIVYDKGAGPDLSEVVVGQVRGDEGGDDDDDDDDDDGGDDIAQIQELVGWRDRFRRSARVACNRRWIAMSRKGSGSLKLWRVEGGVASEDHLECSVAKKLLRLRFFTTTSAYDSESDTLELSFLEDDLVLATSIVIHHVDLRKVWQEGAITMDSVSVISDCCLSEPLSSGLCSPLLDRDKVVYYLPVTKVCSTEPRKKVPGSLSRTTLGQLSFKAPARTIEKHYLLDLNTGEPIAWLKTPEGQ
ncbi:hypothetical protein Pelo_2391 [Pelomyxa schiedti]|nr:hypothetical protein Pelo_2391 [Pelomyxa schiedti]